MRSGAFHRLALDISALHLGTGVAGALGGAVIDMFGIRFPPLTATVLTALSFLLAMPSSGALRRWASGAGRRPERIPG